MVSNSEILELEKRLFTDIADNLAFMGVIILGFDIVLCKTMRADCIIVVHVTLWSMRDSRGSNIRRGLDLIDGAHVVGSNHAWMISSTGPPTQETSAVLGWNSMAHDVLRGPPFLNPRIW